MLLWVLAWQSLSISYWLTFAISLINAGFLLRLFTIQHDCGHGAFFENRTVNDWLGRVIGVLTLTPYDVWRQSHSMHHSSSGHLGRRGMGDVHTLTVAEYNALSPFHRWLYRLYRNPIVLFGLGPGYLFVLQNRIPLGLTNKAKYWVSAMCTNAGIVCLVALVFYFGGLLPILLILLPTTLLAAMAGVWLFYVQHQFEGVYWERHEAWNPLEAALKGSSYYRLPAVIGWFTGNIGLHHIHHIQPRIPNYRLRECQASVSALDSVPALSIARSLRSLRIGLFDEASRRSVSFRFFRRTLATGKP